MELLSCSDTRTPMARNAVEYTKTFSDVAPDAWYADAVHTLAALGIIKGMTEYTFAPNEPITRAQFMAICARFTKVSAEGDEFVDVPETHWAHDYISTASAFGWISGVGDGKFAPNDRVSRAATSVIVNRMLGRVPDRAAIDSTGVQRYGDVTGSFWAWYDINEASTGVLPR